MVKELCDELFRILREIHDEIPHMTKEELREIQDCILKSICELARLGEFVETARIAIEIEKEKKEWW